MIRVYKTGANKTRKLIGIARNYLLRGDYGYLISSEWIDLPNGKVLVEYDDPVKEDCLRVTTIGIKVNTPLTESNLGEYLGKVLFTITS